MSQNDFSGKLVFHNQPLSAEDSPVSPIHVQENAKALAMSVTCGQNCGELFAKLNRDGFWVKTSQDSVQVRMDGSSVEYCETWPRWGMLLGGVVGKLRMSVPRTTENGSLLLPTLMGAAATMECAGKEYCGTRHSLKLTQALEMLPTPTSRDYKDTGKMENVPVNALLGRELGKNHGMKLQPAFAEWMMGFPPEWTALGASEMPSSRSKSTRSSKPSQILKGRT